MSYSDKTKNGKFLLDHFFIASKHTIDYIKLVLLDLQIHIQKVIASGLLPSISIPICYRVYNTHLIESDMR